MLYYELKHMPTLLCDTLKLLFMTGYYKLDYAILFAFHPKVFDERAISINQSHIEFLGEQEVSFRLSQYTGLAQEILLPEVEGKVVPPSSVHVQ